jgi:hypothetical protein
MLAQCPVSEVRNGDGWAAVNVWKVVLAESPNRSSYSQDDDWTVVFMIAALLNINAAVNALAVVRPDRAVKPESNRQIRSGPTMAPPKI